MGVAHALDESTDVCAFDVLDDGAVVDNAPFFYYMAIGLSSIGIPREFREARCRVVWVADPARARALIDGRRIVLAGRDDQPEPARPQVGDRGRRARVAPDVHPQVGARAARMAPPHATFSVVVWHATLADDDVGGAKPQGLVLPSLLSSLSHASAWPSSQLLFDAGGRRAWQVALAKKKRHDPSFEVARFCDR